MEKDFLDLIFNEYFQIQKKSKFNLKCVQEENEYLKLDCRISSLRNIKIIFF